MTDPTPFAHLSPTAAHEIRVVADVDVAGEATIALRCTCDWMLYFLDGEPVTLNELGSAANQHLRHAQIRNEYTITAEQSTMYPVFIQVPPGTRFVDIEGPA